MWGKEKRDVQSTNTEKRHDLQLHGFLHLQAPKSRQWCQQKHEVCKHIHARHDHEKQIDLDTFSFDRQVPASLHWYALEDGAQHHDTTVGYDEDTDGVEEDAESAAGEDARV